MRFESGVRGILFGSMIIALQLTVREELVKGCVIHSQVRVTYYRIWWRIFMVCCKGVVFTQAFFTLRVFIRKQKGAGVKLECFFCVPPGADKMVFFR